MPSPKKATPKRSRSRSLGRSRSPARKPKRDSKAKESPSPSLSRSRGRPRGSSKSRKVPLTPKLVTTSTPVLRTTREVTPTRSSARLAAIKTDVEAMTSLTWKLGQQQTITTTNSKMETQTKHAPSTPADDIESNAFGGSFGTFIMIFFLPAVMFYVNFACQRGKCDIRKVPTLPRKLRAYIDLQSFLVVSGWFAFQAVLAMLPTGKLVDGQAIKGGKRLQYRCNGKFAFVITLLAFGIAFALKHPLIRYVPNNFFKLMTSSAVFSCLLSVFLAVKARNARPSSLSPYASGNFIFNFFMGRELNPRIGSFDLKFFCELRPGLIGWVVIDMCFVASSCWDKQTNYGLMLVTCMHMLYVMDSLWFEESILTTMDIVHDGFGFMLSFGDLAWVPFLYTLTARFLFENRQTMPTYCLVCIGLLNMVGYVIFRGSNSQKDAFRRNPYDPALAHLESMPTSAGKRLLLSGWWGLCRHPNYLGDLIMALAWSLSCGTGHIIPYFYPIYFLLLLIHRERRDSSLCRSKYGPAWTRYCDKVRYRIFPYIY